MPSFPLRAFEKLEAGQMELASRFAFDRMGVDQWRPHLGQHQETQRKELGVSNQSG
jgi:hypothetical protein